MGCSGGLRLGGMGGGGRAGVVVSRWGDNVWCCLDIYGIVVAIAASQEGKCGA
jgi:hypothetical protein